MLVIDPIHLLFGTCKNIMHSANIGERITNVFFRKLSNMPGQGKQYNKQINKPQIEKQLLKAVNNDIN